MIGAIAHRKTVDPELYGPWIKYDGKGDVPAPKMKPPSSTSKTSSNRTEDEQKNMRKGKEKEGEHQAAESEDQNYTIPEMEKFKIFSSVPEKLKAIVIDRKMKEFQEEDFFEEESTHAFNATSTEGEENMLGKK